MTAPLLAVVLLGSVFAISYVLYNIFFHPLAEAPGPLLSKISTFPSFYHAYRGDRHIWLWQLFEKYGDKIRTGPNTILFKSPSAYNAIYDPRGNFERSPFYHVFPRNDNDYNTLTTTDVQAHARKRRLLKQAFTERSIKASGVFISRHIDRWNELLLQNPDWSEPQDVTEKLDYLIFDILGDLCFGADFETKEPGKSPLKAIPHLITKYMAFQYPLTKSPMRDLILWLKPRGLNQLMSACTPKHIKEFYAFVQENVDNRYRRFKESEDPEPAQADGASPYTKPDREDMFYFLCSAKDPHTQRAAFSKQELLAEARLLVIAGTDTTSTSLSALLFYLGSNNRVYNRLVAEIRSTFDTPDKIVHGPKLASCKYLHAVILETMRMTPAGPSEPERLVRTGGATIDGRFYPAGTNVGIPQWAYYHNEDIFRDAWTFRPERWIESDESPIEDIFAMKRVFSPFIKGVNNCVGQNLATLVVSLVAARTLWRMDCRIAPGTNVGEGRQDCGWGMRNKKVYQVKDAFISLRKGPIMQFREVVR